MNSLYYVENIPFFRDHILNMTLGDCIPSIIEWEDNATKFFEIKMIKNLETRVPVDHMCYGQEAFAFNIVITCE